MSDVTRTDHTGREFPTRSAMAAAWGVLGGTLNARLERGWSVQDALTVPVKGRVGPVPSTDHKGRVFPSQGAMCEAWGVKQQTFLNRRRRGWDLEDALTGAPSALGPVKGRPITDWDGMDFRSIAAMARWHKLPYNVVYWRLRHGWHPELVVEEPVRHRQKRKKSDDQRA